MRSKIAKEVWDWWCCGPAIRRANRIMRAREKRPWKKSEERAG